MVKGPRRYGSYRPTGIIVDVSNKARNREYENGERHMFVVIAVFKVDPTESHQSLDHENLLQIVPTGCFHCEVVWTPGMELTPCPGEPKN